MNPYSFVKSRRSIVATNVNATAQPTQTILDLNEANNRRRLQAKYVFHGDAKFTEKLVRDIETANLVLSSYSDGTARNLLDVKFKDGTGRQYRVYGTEKEVRPEKAFSSEEIAAMSFGYCTTADVVVTEKDGNDDIVAIYANLA